MKHLIVHIVVRNWNGVLTVSKYVIELPLKSVRSELTYPESVDYIKCRFEAMDIKVNVDDNTIEKLWYAFSELYDASFLIPDEELVASFIEYIKDIDTDTADRMNYYGTDTGSVYRPWDREDDDE